MHGLADDLIYALRLLRKSPGFALASILTLVLGIVLNTCAFSVVNVLWFHPLPFRDDGRIMVLSERNVKKGAGGGLSYQDYVDVRREARAFSEVAGFVDATFNLGSGGAEPERVSGGLMSVSALQMLGFSPQLGRGFVPEEQESPYTARGARVVLISDRLWRNRFGADRGIIGREITVDGARASIIGVLPRDFRFVYGGYQVIAPLTRDTAHVARSVRNVQVMGRLRDGATLDAARAELRGISERLAREYPETNAGWGVRVADFRRAVFAQAMKMYPILLAAGALVLLIVCANVANLLLAKAAGRTREIAVRIALGAARMRIVRQMVTEGLLIAGTAAAVALALAFAAGRLLVASYPEMEGFQLDFRVFGYTLFMALAAGMVFGLAPALTSSRPDLNAVLKAGERGLSRGGSHRLRSVLVTSELTVALVLLAGTGLLIRTIANLRNAEVGFRAGNLLTAELSLDPTRYGQPEQRIRFYRQLLENVASQPGVVSAALVSMKPLWGGGQPTAIELPDRPPRAGGEPLRIAAESVSPRYFETMGIRVITGRADGNAGVVLNEASANLLWPGPNAVAEAIGKRIRVGENGVWTTVAGVAANVRQLPDRPAWPELYTAYEQAPGAGMTIVVRTAAAPKTLTGALKREVRALDRDIPVGSIETVDEIISDFFPKVMVVGLGAFASVAMALAALGLYGVVAFLVTQRTQEIGVRVALGATRGQIVRLVVGEGVKLASVGSLLGIAGAFGLARVLSGFLYQVSATDPMVFGAVACVLCLVAITASWLPALRASRVEPVVALRDE